MGYLVFKRVQDVLLKPNKDFGNKMCVQVQKIQDRISLGWCYVALKNLLNIYRLNIPPKLLCL